MNESKQSYVKPSVEVYEIEVEGVIMDNASKGTSNYNQSNDNDWG